MQASLPQTEESEIDREYKARAASNRFGQQISYGVGAAMVFGLFSGAAGVLFKIASAGAANGLITAGFLMPALGLVAMAALGVSALYMSAKFISRATLLDNEMQARKIQQAKQQALSNDVSVPTPEKPAQSFPQTMPDVAAEISDAVPEKKWADRFEKSSGSMADLAAKGVAGDSQNWGDKVKAAEPASDKPLAAL